jgi:hypothetical protein
VVQLHKTGEDKLVLCYECLILVCNFWCRSCAGHICNSIGFIEFAAAWTDYLLSHGFVATNVPGH